MFLFDVTAQTEVYRALLGPIQELFDFLTSF